MDDWFSSLRAISGPGPETVQELELVVETEFEEIQDRVHVVTGSLKGSGRTAYKKEDNSWSGEISYGGPSPGFSHNPVTYAEKEFSQGGQHDPFRRSYLIHDDLRDALYASMRVRVH